VAHHRARPATRDSSRALVLRTGPGRADQTLVQQSRVTAQPVVEALPPPVQPPAQAVGDTVEQTAGTVDEALAPVAGEPLP
jgi:hypothetical protein